HLVEHLYVTAAAGETKARTADEFMARYPAGWNAQTGDRYTVFATVFPKESLDAELQEAAARMAELQIMPLDLEREKPRVTGEVSNRFGGNPLLVVQNQARERTRPSPLAGRKAGLPEHVTALSVDDVQARWEQFYKPRNATLVVAGGIDPALARAAVTRHFAGIRAGTQAPDAAQPGQLRPGRADDIDPHPLHPAIRAPPCL